MLYFVNKKKRKRKTEHFSFGFSVKPAKKTIWERIQCPCVGIMWRPGLWPEKNPKTKQKREWLGRFFVFSTKTSVGFGLLFLLLAAKQDRPKKPTPFFGFVFFWASWNRPSKSVFGWEKPTKNNRKKRRSVIGSDPSTCNQPLHRNYRHWLLLPSAVGSSTYSYSSSKLLVQKP